MATLETREIDGRTVYVNICITDIKTVEDFEYCAQHLEGNLRDGNHTISQTSLDEYVANHNEAFYDDGCSRSNFYSWGKGGHNYKNCTHMTVAELKKITNPIRVWDI